MSTALQPRILAALLAVLLLQDGDMASAAIKKPHAEKSVCLVKGGKFVVPVMDDAAICARMLAGVKAGAGAARIQSIAIRFLPQGVARAEIVHVVKGAPRRDTSELAVSDRKLSPHDVDRLAKDIAAVMGTIRK